MIFTLKLEKNLSFKNTQVRNICIYIPVILFRLILLYYDISVLRVKTCHATRLKLYT